MQVQSTPIGVRALFQTWFDVKHQSLALLYNITLATCFHLVLRIKKSCNRDTALQALERTTQTSIDKPLAW